MGVGRLEQGETSSKEQVENDIYEDSNTYYMVERPCVLS